MGTIGCADRPAGAAILGISAEINFAAVRRVIITVAEAAITRIGAGMSCLVADARLIIPKTAIVVGFAGDQPGILFIVGVLTIVRTIGCGIFGIARVARVALLARVDEVALLISALRGVIAARIERSADKKKLTKKIVLAVFPLRIFIIFFSIVILIKQVHQVV